MSTGTGGAGLIDATRRRFAMPTYPTVDESLDRLHRDDWGIGDAVAGRAVRRQPGQAWEGKGEDVNNPAEACLICGEPKSEAWNSERRAHVRCWAIASALPDRKPDLEAAFRSVVNATLERAARAADVCDHAAEAAILIRSMKEAVA